MGATSSAPARQSAWFVGVAYPPATPHSEKNTEIFLNAEERDEVTWDGMPFHIAHDTETEPAGYVMSKWVRARDKATMILGWLPPTRNASNYVASELLRSGVLSELSLTFKSNMLQDPANPTNLYLQKTIDHVALTAKGQHDGCRILSVKVEQDMSEERERHYMQIIEQMRDVNKTTGAYRYDPRADTANTVVTQLLEDVTDGVETVGTEMANGAEVTTDGAEVATDVAEVAIDVADMATIDAEMASDLTSEEKNQLPIDTTVEAAALAIEEPIEIPMSAPATVPATEASAAPAPSQLTEAELADMALQNFDAHQQATKELEVARKRIAELEAKTAVATPDASAPATESALGKRKAEASDSDSQRNVKAMFTKTFHEMFDAFNQQAAVQQGKSLTDASKISDTDAATIDNAATWFAKAPADVGMMFHNISQQTVSANRASLHQMQSAQAELQRIATIQQAPKSVPLEDSTRQRLMAARDQLLTTAHRSSGPLAALPMPSAAVKVESFAEPAAPAVKYTVTDPRAFMKSRMERGEEIQRNMKEQERQAADRSALQHVNRDSMRAPTTTSSYYGQPSAAPSTVAIDPELFKMVSQGTRDFSKYTSAQKDKMVIGSRT